MQSSPALSFESAGDSQNSPASTAPSPFYLDPLYCSTPNAEQSSTDSQFDTPDSLIIASSSFLQADQSPATPVRCPQHIYDYSTPHVAKRRKLFHSSLPVDRTSLAASQTLTPESSVSNQVSLLLATACCNKRCLAHFTVVEAEEVKYRFRSKTIAQQNQFLLDSFLITTSVEDSSPGNQCIEGKHICSDAFIRLLGISNKRYKRLFTSFSEGVTSIQRKPVVRNETAKATEAKAWMSQYFNRVGDQMPHIKQIHLPHCLTKRDLYKKMKSELESQGIAESEVISPSHFYRIWSKSFSHVVIPEVSIYFFILWYLV